jgi:hypothetical protein
MIKIGTDIHKDFFCRDFLNSHISYDPETMDWPKLDSDTLDKLRAIPFWEEAVSIETRAGKMVSAFAKTIEDPLLREAIALQGQEEARHGRLLKTLITKYDLGAVARPGQPLSRQLEAEFIEFGYDECLDSYFAFGLFGIARQAGFVPDSLFTLFDPILDEEARHIVFFVNWIAYLETQRGAGAGWLRGLKSMGNYARSLKRQYSTFGRSTNEGFTAKGALNFNINLTIEEFLDTCVAENRKRMSQFHPALLQPVLLPQLSVLVLKIIRLWPFHKTRTNLNPKSA